MKISCGKGKKRSMEKLCGRRLFKSLNCVLKKVFLRHILFLNIPQWQHIFSNDIAKRRERERVKMRSKITEAAVATKKKEKEANVGGINFMLCDNIPFLMVR